MAGWGTVVTSEADPAALATTKMPLVEDVYSCDITKQPTGNCGPPLPSKAVKEPFYSP